MALTSEPSQEVTVIDVGLELDARAQEVKARLSVMTPDQWEAETVAVIAAQPAGMARSSLPEKRTYGSLYPFADAGQLSGIQTETPTNPAVVSAAYGGFSNVWGAQILPFTAGLLARWPVPYEVMERHYRAVLERIPFAGQEDDLATLFPLIAKPHPLPVLSPRSLLTISNYERNRTRLTALGITLGRARLAFDAHGCARCGLCMTGCPYSLIYSSAHTFDALRRQRRVVYRDKLLVHKVEEEDEQVVVHATDLTGSSPIRFEADRVFLACGGVGTPRVILNSREVVGEELLVRESRQFVVPFVSRRPTPDPRLLQDFTLNQFNMVMAFDDRGVDLSVIHFYSYNPAVLTGLPQALRSRWGRSLQTQAATRLTVALGYLPSWHSPPIRLSLRGVGESRLGPLALSEDRDDRQQDLFPKIMRRLWRAAPYLDLWPVTPAAFVSGAAKSYHFGGTFPHAHQGEGSRFSTDPLGRLRWWKRVHLVDGSVLPDIPATTFTLTVMANAHRIASEVIRLGR